ncbi:MBL fold metallo-hydrolase [Vitiosangium sp. GDMCC 1.1324]|uniref:MBL fold metallo-hydrolase n=1 Tax=Vitiosangium sp. (strain GDMCC 1.1324) TaxID=2138576 RepID=UPI000D3805F0|nr:MBL fold metallo-hydrolase [Vitiosangium sp. GDMCC 1.1324]PTL76696.1 MBL fold metallo-hydrolase [Vitiosangium sp. GDMCC 1.1324]
MRVHHINCGTLCPASSRFVLGEGGLFSRARMVCHCLVLETHAGLVLVDTGLGLRDIEDPSRLGRRFISRNAPRLEPHETAAVQVERLGFKREDVRHIIPTHLDLDHAGGLADFPDAEVHIFRDEHEAAFAPAGRSKKYGYRPVQWAHGPRWNRHAVEGERWFGFEAVRVIPGLSEQVLLVPLVGHSEGHCGVAVKTDSGWLLHAGDAYFSHREIDPVAPRSPPGLALFQRLRSADNAARLANQARLRNLVREHSNEVRVFSAHCAVEFDRHVASPLPPASSAGAWEGRAASDMR